MMGLNAYEKFARGDTQDALNEAGMLLNSLQPGMNVWGQDQGTMQNVAAQQAQQDALENAFNQWLYQMHQSGGVGANSLGDFFQNWSFGFTPT
jgi:ABC-type amino acid transport substrate-binding protein